MIIVGFDPGIATLGYGVIKKDNKGKCEVGGQAVLGRQGILSTPWLTERHGYDPTYI